ncbi:MAG: response regulator [Candidatus Rokubacteria bacterium]|nr:response regulator [Candidatus Rokubacteria bacterium]
MGAGEITANSDRPEELEAVADLRRASQTDAPALAAALETLARDNARLSRELQNRLEDLRRAEAQLADLEKLVGLNQLIGGMAHELNNPLAAVLACLTILQELPLAAEAQDLVDRIRTQTERAIRVVKNLATYAKRPSPERVLTDVHELLRQGIELLDPSLRHASITVQWECAADLPLCAVDPNQMLQVFVNLFVNARQAIESTGRGRGTIRIGMAAEPARVRVEIADDGPGIPADLRERIFDPFFTTKPPGVGTGLGLSLCQAIVEAHGGSLLARSDAAGATLLVALPIGAAQALDAEASQASPAPTGRILVVDDETDLRGALSHLLRRAGHVTQEAGSGSEALAMLDTGQFDAIILDVRLPDINGQALLEEIARRDPALARKVVITTGDVLGQETQSFLERTDAPCLSKPFTLKALLGALAAVMGDQSRA